MEDFMEELMRDFMDLQRIICRLWMSRGSEFLHMYNDVKCKTGGILNGFAKYRRTCIEEGFMKDAKFFWGFAKGCS